jgi:hypothetical protein
MITLRYAVLAAIAAAVFAASSAGASAQETLRVRGTIHAVSASDMSVATRDGEMITVKLAEQTGVGSLARASLADIRPNSFVGIVGVPMEGGRLRAVEVLIFPEALRGAGEGQGPWDLLPESTMTNATVADTVASVDGATLTVKYKGSEQPVFVPADAPIVTPAAADRSDLKPGAKVFIGRATKQADGSYAANRITVAKNGVEPPM